MASLTQQPLSPLCSRKRRREDGPPTSIEMQKKLTSPHHPRHAPFSDTTAILSTDLSPSLHHCDRRLLVPKPRHDWKRQRVEPSSAIDREPLREPDDAAARATRKQKTDLSPCHICHRKPTVRAELDAFADCEGCARRTCYICIRECPGLGDGGVDPLDEGEGMAWGMTGHRRMVCSGCCVERGTEGEVWCMGCLRSETG